MKRGALATLVALFAAGCSYGTGDVDPDSIPRNPHPGRPIQVVGFLPAGFSVPQLRAVYGTHSSSPFCNGITLPDGGPFPRRTKLVVRTRETPGQVTAEIEPDAFRPGVCEWQLADIYAIVKSPRGETAEARIGIAYGWYLARGMLGDLAHRGDTSTFYCGHKHGPFGCGDGPIGDASYLPLEIKAGTSRVNFVVRDSGYNHPVS